MKILYYFLFLLLLGLSIPCMSLAQQKRIQQLRQVAFSLQKKINFKADTQYIQLLNDLAFAYRRVNPDSTLLYAQLARDLAKKNKFSRGEAESFRMEGLAWFIKAKYDQALHNYTLAMRIFEKNNYQKGLGATLSNTGMVYYEKGNYSQALEYLFAGLKIQEAINDKNGIAVTCNFLGMTYHNQENYNQALNHHIKGLKHFQFIKDTAGIATSLHHIASNYDKQKNFESALHYYSQALKMRELIGDKQGEAFSLSRLGNVYVALNQLDSALIYYNKALKIQHILADKQGETTSLKELAKLKFKQNKSAETLLFGLQGLQLAEEIKAKKEMQEISEILAQVYENQNDWKNALKYYKNFKLYSDSLFNKQRSEEIGKLEAQREFDKKEQTRIIEQNQRNLAHEKQLARQNWIIATVLSVLIAILVITILLFWNNRQKHQHNLILQIKQEEIIAQNEELLAFQEQVATQRDELLEKNQVIESQNHRLVIYSQQLETLVAERTQQLQTSYKELDTFLYRSSHDLRRPLTTIMGLNQILQISTQDTALLDLCRKTNITAQNMDKMLRKLQFISELSNDEEKELEEVDLTIFVHKILAEFKMMISTKNIEIEFLNQISPFLHLRGDVFYAILYNLIENSIIFSYATKAWVKIEIIQSTDYREIKISDNAGGIVEQYQAHIFDMYVRANENSQGNGLGLYVVKKAAEKLQGKVFCESLPGEGSIFTIQIPKEI